VKATAGEAEAVPRPRQRQRMVTAWLNSLTKGRRTSPDLAPSTSSIPGMTSGGSSARGIRPRTRARANPNLQQSPASRPLTTLYRTLKSPPWGSRLQDFSSGRGRDRVTGEGGPQDMVTPAEVMLVLRPGSQSPRGHSAERLPLLAAMLLACTS
jgi:hypothetical protein